MNASPSPTSSVVETGLPWVIAKWAQTLDGKTATRTGDSKWISNEALTTSASTRLRARVDAVVVGIGTVRADDPTLTARDVEIKRTSRRVVVDPNLSLPDGCKLIQTIDQAPLTVADRSSASSMTNLSMLKQVRRSLGVELLGLPTVKVRKPTRSPPIV